MDYSKIALIFRERAKLFTMRFFTLFLLNSLDKIVIT